MKTRGRHLLEMAPPRRVIFSTRSICHGFASVWQSMLLPGTMGYHRGTMGKIRLTQFMPKFWEKLQTCVQHRRDMKLGRKKSEPWLGKGVVNNPSKAWDIWYAVQCERSKVETNWVGANHHGPLLEVQVSVTLAPSLLFNHGRV